MCVRLLLLWAVLLVGFAPAPFPRPKKSQSSRDQLKKLQGQWVRTRSIIGGRVFPHELLAGEQAERAWDQPRLRRRRGAGAALAAGAVAVAGALGLLRHLETHASAQAVPGVERVAHCTRGDCGIRVSPVTPSMIIAISST